MGGYLDKPNCEKTYVAGTANNRFSYASCSMQGWRISQEDDHNCLPDFDDEKNVSLFAVYDGHGGPEVAKYCSQKLPEYLRSLESYSLSEFEKSLEEAFLGFDSTLLLSEVKDELKKLSEGAEEQAEDKQTDAEKGEELENLSEEAELPLEALLARYGGLAALSPAMRAIQEKKNELASLLSPHLKSKDKKVSEKLKGDSDEGAGSSVGETTGETEDTSQEAATADNQNNENLEKEAAATKTKEKDEKKSEDADVSSPPQSNGISSSSGPKSKSKHKREEVDDEEDDEEFNPDLEEDSDEESDEDEEEDSEDDSDEEEDSEDDDDDDDEDQGILGMLPGLMSGGDAAPGSESGSTAVVALLVRDKDSQRLVVANAGDSRCVLCRADGTAENLSVDHKPEDESERSRIESAGGIVTKEGRVNGGLNLSRAIGDHAYKENVDKGAREQMIVATPDVMSAELRPGDRFFLLACDGIWNSLSSQEVCDFVSERLYERMRGDMKSEEQEKILKDINSELFEHCIADDTNGDGTGCDNMTCIIVSLSGATLAPVPPRQVSDETVEMQEKLESGKKRNGVAESDDIEMKAKRPRTDEEVQDKIDVVVTGDK